MSCNIVPDMISWTKILNMKLLQLGAMHAYLSNLSVIKDEVVLKLALESLCLTLVHALKKC